MRKIAAAVVLLLIAAPLTAQRSPRKVPRVAPAMGPFVRPGFFDPGVVERRPVVPMHLGAIPFPPLTHLWIRAETPHFILISAIDEHGTRALANDLEKFTSLLTTASSTYFQLPAARTRVFLFAERRNAQPYFDAIVGAHVDANGITLRHPKGSTMLIDTAARGGSTLTPRHELVHDLLHQHEKPLPLWIDEGLAEYYSNGGQPIREHVSRVRGRLRMPLPQMFSTRAEDKGAWTFDFYAQSWAAVATLMRRDPKAFFEFLGDLQEGTGAAAAIQARYRMSLRDLEFAMRKVAAPAPSLITRTPAPAALQLTSMSRADLLYELADLLVRVKGREAEADRHFRAALAANGATGAMHLAYAELLLALPDCAADARVQAQSALDADAKLAMRAHGIIGLSYLATSDPVTARPYLEGVYDTAPEQADFAFALFSLYIDAGERAAAERVFQNLADTPRGNDARRLFLNTDVPRADTLAREGKLLEAARILRDLAPKMPGKTRANLEGQAVRLESIAAMPQP